MQIGIYGSGYLGTVIAACTADFGVPVTFYDRDEVRLTHIAGLEIPFHEPNLKEMVRRNIRAGRLLFSTDMESFARRAPVIFLAEDSPAYIEEVAFQIARTAMPGTLLVISTPVPVGTAERIDQRLRDSDRDLTVVSHPVFLTDGCAVEDFNWPDRIVLGTTSSQAVLTLKQLYRPLVMRGVPVIVTSFNTAELVREASTAFVATKISFINELAGLCEQIKADAVDLALALGLDKKIAPRCLQPGAGLGGAFVEADLEALGRLAGSNGVNLKILGAAREVNRMQCDRIIDKVARTLDSLTGKDVGLLGLSFKPNTSSVAQSVSIQVARGLLARGARVRAYDPVAMADAKVELNGSVKYCESAYAAAEGADAVVVSTGWPEFRALDFERIKRGLKKPVIVDTKNLLDGSRLRSMGFQYVGVGRG
jgi:UDPglucose 6-dehydrogenase